MPDPHNILIVSPVWEDLELDVKDIPVEARDILDYRFQFLTQFTGWYADIIEQAALSKGFNVVHITGDAPTKELVESVLNESDPLIFVHADHGSADKLFCKDWMSLINSDNASLLANRIVYTISCSSAKQLGQDVINNGGLAYFGYSESAWVMLLKWKKQGEQDIINWDEACMDCFTSGLTRGILEGKTVEESWEEMWNTYSDSIKYYETHKDPYGIWNMSIMVLMANRNALRMLGGSEVAPSTQGVPALLSFAIAGIIPLGIMGVSKM